MYSSSNDRAAVAVGVGVVVVASLAKSGPLLVLSLHITNNDWQDAITICLINHITFTKWQHYRAIKAY